MFQAFMRSCALQMGINYVKMNFSIGISKAFNPDRDMRQKPQQGEKIFDWKNSKWFALNSTDCQKIMDYLRQPNGELFLTHDSGNGNYNYFKFHVNGDSTFIGIGPKGDMVSTALYGENYAAFMNGVQFLLTQVPWYNDFLKEMGKIIAGQSAFNPGNGPDGKPWGQSNSNNYNDNGNYNPNNGDGEWPNSVSYTPGPDTGYQQPQQNTYNGGYQKKQYNNNGGYQKKPYGNGGYQRNNYNNNYQQAPAPIQPPRPPQVQQPVPVPPQTQPPRPPQVQQPVPVPPAPPAVDNFTI